MRDINQFNKIVFFTGAGMSAESGIPTYRGEGGVWKEYRWTEYACQDAFIHNPSDVLDFHELRRIEALKCQPHVGHDIITKIQHLNPETVIVTQNIDGMHQRSGSVNIIELHGSLWRLRCEKENILFENLEDGRYENRKCNCGEWLRPDIIWFQDMLNQDTVSDATRVISEYDLFISIGTSALVWPAAGYPTLAKNSGAFCIEINPEATENSSLYDENIRQAASAGLSKIFN